MQFRIQQPQKRWSNKFQPNRINLKINRLIESTILNFNVPVNLYVIWTAESEFTVRVPKLDRVFYYGKKYMNKNTPVHFWLPTSDSNSQTQNKAELTSLIPRTEIFLNEAVLLILRIKFHFLLFCIACVFSMKLASICRLTD